MLLPESRWLASAALALAVAGCTPKAASTAVTDGGEIASPPPLTSPASPASPPAPHVVAFDGGRVAVDPLVAATATVTAVAACPLEDPTFKPDGRAPAHVAVRFVAAGATKTAATSCSVPATGVAGLYVFPAEDFAQMWPAAKTALQGLARMLDARALPAEERMPFVPFVDASFALSSRLTFIDFEGGKGALFLGELSHSPETLGAELIYVFQGLSADRKRYVLAIIPAATKRKMAPFVSGPDVTGDALLAAFEEYRAAVDRDFASLRDEELAPPMDAVARTLSTLALAP